MAGIGDFSRRSSSGKYVRPDLAGRLESYFAEKRPFTDPCLKIGDVSAALCTNESYLSKTLNGIIRKNFRQYVDCHRIRYACSLFIDNDRLGISSLADMSGFRNRALFARAFVFNVGIMPAEWCGIVRERRKRGEAVSVDEYFQKGG